MLCNFAKSGAITSSERVRNFLLRNKVSYVSPEHYSIPEAKACRDALYLVRYHSSSFLVDHSSEVMLLEWL